MQIINYIEFNTITSTLNKSPMMKNLFLSVTDTEGRALSSTKWPSIFENFHRKNNLTYQKCQTSTSRLVDMLSADQSYNLHIYSNGLAEAIAPFVVDGEKIGNLIVGQFFLEAPDIDFFITQAKQYEFDTKAYIKAVKAIRVINQNELAQIMIFCSELTSLLYTTAKQARLFKEQANKLANRTKELEYVNNELEAFSYSISHDLRAPLRHIMGFIELFNKKYADTLPQQGKHYFDVIHESSKNMGVLMDELLQFSRNGRIEMKQSDVDMNDIVASCVQSIMENIKDRCIEWRIGALWPAMCDKEMLKLVWTNLIDNAVKFTQNTQAAQIEVGCFKENKKIVYFIKDNGAGFDMRYAQKLFGVFQRLHLKEEFNGTGIGLASAKRIISRHGGRIWAQASPNKGAAFYFTLS